RAMANIEATDATGKIEVAIAVDVFDSGAIRAGCKDRRGICRAARDGGLASGHERARLWPGNFRAKLDCFHWSLFAFTNGSPHQANWLIRHKKVTKSPRRPDQYPPTTIRRAFGWPVHVSTSRWAFRRD